jgi:hypothetical protein
MGRQRGWCRTRRHAAVRAVRDEQRWARSGAYSAGWRQEASSSEDGIKWGWVKQGWAKRVDVPRGVAGASLCKYRQRVHCWTPGRQRLRRPGGLESGRIRRGGEVGGGSGDEHRRGLTSSNRQRRLCAASSTCCLGNCTHSTLLSTRSLTQDSDRRGDTTVPAAAQQLLPRLARWPYEARCATATSL